MAYRRFPLALMAAGLLLIPACKSGPPSSGSPSGKDEAALVERKVEYLEGLLGATRRGRACPRGPHLGPPGPRLADRGRLR